MQVKRSFRSAGRAALAAALAVLVAAAPAVSETLKIDRNHTNVGFRVRHFNTMVNGRFREFEGTIEFDEKNKTASKVDVTIQAASVDTNVERRDNDLRSPNFFDVEKYPTLTFTSTAVTDVSGNRAKIKGLLTIRDVTKEVVLDTEYLGKAKSPRGNVVHGFQATTRINRRDFGITWGAVLETGGVMVGDEVDILIDVEAGTPPPPRPQ